VLQDDPHAVGGALSSLLYGVRPTGGSWPWSPSPPRWSRLSRTPARAACRERLIRSTPSARS